MKWISPLGYAALGPVERRRIAQKKLYWKDPKKSREKQRAKDARRKEKRQAYTKEHKDQRRSSQRRWEKSEAGREYKRIWARKRYWRLKRANKARPVALQANELVRAGKARAFDSGFCAGREASQ